MKRLWWCALLLATQGAWAVAVSPAFSRQLAPVMKLYEAKQWQAADAKAATLKPATPAEEAWLAQLRASAAANAERWEVAATQVAMALRYDQWPQEQKRALLRLQGDIAAQQERWPQAIASYKAALALQSEKALQFRLAGLYFHNQQYAEAASLSEQLLRQGWHKPAALIRLSALHGLKQYAQAAEMAELLINHEPDEGKWWQQAVALRISARQGRQALALLQTAVDRKVISEESTRTQLVRLYAWQGLPYRGARLLELAMRDGKMSASVANVQLLAQLWEGAREWNKAITTWQQLASLNQESKPALRAAELMLQQGRDQEAGKQLLSLQRSTGKEGWRAKALLLQIYLQSERYDEALQLANQLRGSREWQERADAWIAYIQSRQSDSGGKSA
ncbi:hypothetical protein ACET66_19180 [Aeromonas simiae]|uniref:tetratricopeptide repeat protein n=1 Tax=Aeromonas simiae TaxID=218936 RepID=UPI0038CF71FF